MKLIYVAGRYRGRTPQEVENNIAGATLMGRLVAETSNDLYPVIPHTNTKHFEYLVERDDDYYIEGTLEMLRRCDAVLLVPGYHTSSGTIGEIREAQRLGLRVYENYDQLYMDFRRGVFDV